MSRLMGSVALAFVLICSPAWADTGDDELNKFVRVLHDGVLSLERSPLAQQIILCGGHRIYR